MTRLDNVFMLPIDAVLNFDTMAEVEYHGKYIFGCVHLIYMSNFYVNFI